MSSQGVNPSRYDISINPQERRSSYFWLLSFLKNARTVLEIGCATGFFSQYLVHRGQQVTGIEIDPQTAQKASGVCQQVIIGDVESSCTRAQIQERFDAVLLGDTLEHLKQPEEILVYIKQHWLKPEGIVVLSVPNAGHWIFRREVLRGRFPYRKYGLFDHSHLRFYTRSALQALVAECGYSILACAVSVNNNRLDDRTFTCLGRLYQHRYSYGVLLSLETHLARIWPTLFAYQFILKLAVFQQ